jgi:hypothetical protein
VYWDNSGTSGYSYTIDAIDTALTTTTHLTTAENAPATAVGVTAPAYVDQGSVTTSTTQQWIKVPVAAGHYLRVITDGNPLTDTQVLIFTSLVTAKAGTAAATCDTNDGNEVLAEDCEAPVATAAGTYYVEITQGGLFDGTHADFTAAVVQQATP